LTLHTFEVSFFITSGFSNKTQEVWNAITVFLFSFKSLKILNIVENKVEKGWERPFEELF
jgi:hypothetical protein